MIIARMNAAVSTISGKVESSGTAEVSIWGRKSDTKVSASPRIQ